MSRCTHPDARQSSRLANWNYCPACHAFHRKAVVVDVVDLTCEACEQEFEGTPPTEDDLHGPFCGDCARH